MILKIKQELYENKIFIFKSLLLVVLTITPQLLTSPSLQHGALLIVLFIFLILLSKLSKTLFAIFIIYLNLINIFLLNIVIHWGNYTGDLSSRINVSLQSPDYEIFEYLSTYVDYRDYFFILYTFLILLFLFKFILKSNYNHKVLKKFSVSIVILFIIILQNQEPIKIIKYYFKTAQMNKSILQRTQFLKNLKTSVKEDILFLYDKIIIIQGESSNKHHLNIYGYDKYTTPFLSNLLKSNQLYLFDAIAPSNQTRYCVPMFFTDANVSNWFTQYSTSQSIITTFKEYGYHTYWISNQGKVGKHEDSITSIAKESDTLLFLNNMTTDAVITDYLEKNILNNNKELYVMHLLGSHFKYSQRYDDENILYKHPKNIIEEYDNTIYFTDYIISRIFNHFTKLDKKVLILYVSDHGEVINHKKNGHGYFPTYKDEYEIPLLVYSNIKNDRIIELLSDNKKYNFNAENLNHFILYISGISNQKNTSNSLEVFSLEPKNIIDYSKIKFYK